MSQEPTGTRLGLARPRAPGGATALPGPQAPLWTDGLGPEGSLPPLFHSGLSIPRVSREGGGPEVTSINVNHRPPAGRPRGIRLGEMGRQDGKPLRRNRVSAPTATLTLPPQTQGRSGRVRPPVYMWPLRGTWGHTVPFPCPKAKALAGPIASRPCQGPGPCSAKTVRGLVPMLTRKANATGPRSPRERAVWTAARLGRWRGIYHYRSGPPASESRGRAAHRGSVLPSPQPGSQEPRALPCPAHTEAVPCLTLKFTLHTAVTPARPAPVTGGGVR